MSEPAWTDKDEEALEWFAQGSRMIPPPWIKERVGLRIQVRVEAVKHEDVIAFLAYAQIHRGA